jgi:hypothetical protein
LDIPIDVIAEIADELPANPRKLKEFFRSLWQLAPVIQRHDSGEVEWSLLLLLELLRAEAPVVTWSLFQSERFRKAAAVSTFFEKTSDDKHKESVRGDIDAEFSRAAMGQTLSAITKERMIRIIRRIGGVSLTTEDRIEYWSQIREEPPWVTLKEAREISTWWMVSSEPGRLRKRLVQHADRVNVTPSQAARGLFRQVLALRQQSLSAAADADVLDDLRGQVSRAQSFLSLLATMIDELMAFDDVEWGFDAEDFIQMYKHFATWAHFTNTNEYQDARRNERDLLLRTASKARLIAVEVLQRIDFLNHLPVAIEGPEKKDLKKRLVEPLLAFVVSDVRARFQRQEGIASLWGTPHSGVYSYVLLSPDGGLYTEEFIETLKGLAELAKKDLGIQKNLIELLRAMVSSYDSGGGAATSPEAKDRLQRAAQFVPVIWRGAIASPIQPRLLASLKEGRERLLGLFQPFGVEFPMPKWWVS